MNVAAIGDCLAQIPQIPQTRTVQSRWCISAIQPSLHIAKRTDTTVDLVCNFSNSPQKEIQDEFEEAGL
jgi:hypothetical protein